MQNLAEKIEERKHELGALDAATTEGERVVAEHLTEQQLQDDLMLIASITLPDEPGKVRIVHAGELILAALEPVTPLVVTEINHGQIRLLALWRKQAVAALQGDWIDDAFGKGTGELLTADLKHEPGTIPMLRVTDKSFCGVTRIPTRSTAMLSDDAALALAELARGLSPGESREWSPNIVIHAVAADVLCIVASDFAASIEIKNERYIAMEGRDPETGEVTRSPNDSKFVAETLISLVKKHQPPARKGVTLGELFPQLLEGMQT